MNQAREEVDRIIRWVNRFTSTKCVVFAAGDTLSDGLVFGGIIEELFGIKMDKIIKRPRNFEQRLFNSTLILNTLRNLSKVHSFSLPTSLDNKETPKQLAQVSLLFLFCIPLIFIVFLSIYLY